MLDHRGDDRPPGGQLGAAADQELHRGEADRRPDEPRDDADRDALDRRQRQQVAPARAAGAQQREVAAVALAGAERGEVGDPEGDQRAGDREQDVERLGVEGVPGRGVQRVGEVVDELHLARAASARTRQRVWSASFSAADGLPALSGAAVELRLHLPLDPLLGAGLGVGGRARRP